MLRLLRVRGLARAPTWVFSAMLMFGLAIQAPYLAHCLRVACPVPPLLRWKVACQSACEERALCPPPRLTAGMDGGVGLLLAVRQDLQPEGRMAGPS